MSAIKYFIVKQFLDIRLYVILVDIIAAIVVMMASAALKQKSVVGASKATKIVSVALPQFSTFELIDVLK
jgi:hypothetical protein